MKLKNKIVLTLICIFAIMNINKVFANSFDFSIEPSEKTIKQGGEATFEVFVDNIDMGEEGLNVVEAVMGYDSEVIDAVQLIESNEWKVTKNNDKESKNYGKFVFLKMIAGVNQREKIGEIKIKLKEEIKVEQTEIIIKNIISNDGYNLVNDEEKSIKIYIEKTQEQVLPKEEVKEIQTGDNIIVWVLIILAVVILGNVIWIIIDKKIKKIR